MINLIPAFQTGKSLIQDISSTINSTEGFRIWWLGQSGFLIQYQSKHLLFDPYLSDSLTQKYKNSDKPHVRMSELVVNPEWLDMIDVVTSSHNHTDHLDAETLLALFKSNPKIKFIIPEANRDFVCERLGCAYDFPVGMNDKEELEIEGFKFIGIPSAHNTVERNEKGKCKFMGFVVQFGQYSVYHSGDTLWFEGLETILKPYKVDVAFLPINGNKPERKVAGNLSAEEAARLGKEIEAKLVIPHHYNMFEFNTENSENFEYFARKYKTPYRILEIGESYK